MLSEEEFILLKDNGFMKYCDSDLSGRLKDVSARIEPDEEGERYCCEKVKPL